MSDLLSSLILPNRSQESFHSTQSFLNPASAPASPPPETSSNSQAAAFQAAGIPIVDVETFLNDPKNQAILSVNAKNNPHQSTQGMSNPTNASSVPLGSTSSHHVVVLYHLCQERGIEPQFDIEGNGVSGFWGWLKVGNETIARDEKWPSKKAAREGLAETGVKVVASMPVKGKEPEDSVQKNWIGILQEFCVNTTTTVGGPEYHEFAIGLNFAATCNIPSHPAPFGSKSVPFPNKKAARANAAREAVQHLISQGQIDPDGNVQRKKKAQNNGGAAPAAVKLQGKVLAVNRDSTYAQRVNDLCPMLGLPPPTYQLRPSSESTPNMLSGGAVFAGSRALPGRVGEVRNVFGKKNAKEECAKGVWKLLREVATERGVEVEVGGGGDGGEEEGGRF